MANLPSFQFNHKTKEMQTSSFYHRLTPPGAPFSGQLIQTRRSFINDHYNHLATTLAFKKDGSNGNIVDENMIVLRERIRKIKEAEMEGGDWLPDNWMEWEKKYIYSGGYHSDVYEMMALLQRFLMGSRPSVALGLVAVLAVSGCTSAAMVLRWLISSITGN